MKDGITKAATFASRGYDYSSSSIFSIGKISFLPRDTTLLTASTSEGYMTVQAVKTPTFSIPTITITIQKDKNADKVAFRNDTSACSAYDEESDQLLSYSCNNATSLQSYDKPSENEIWINKKVASIPLANRFITPYRNGVIGVTPIFDSDEIVNEPIFYTSSLGIKRVPKPEQLAEQNLSFAKIATDTSDRSNKNFLLIGWDGSIYLGTPSDDFSSIEYKYFPPPEKYDSTQVSTICALKGVVASCYVGKSILTPSGDENPDTSTRIDAKYKSIDFTPDTPKILNEHSLGSSLSVDSIYNGDKNTTFALDGKILYKLSNNGRPVEIFSKNIDYVDAANGLYFIRDNSVFKVDKYYSDARLVFKSSHLILKGISSFNGSTYVKASVKGAGGRVYAYRLNNDIHQQDINRLIDVLPLKFSDVKNVSDMDLVGNQLRVRLMTTVNKLSKNRSGAANLENLRENEQLFIEELTKRGISKDNIDIQFSY